MHGDSTRTEKGLDRNVLYVYPTGTLAYTECAIHARPFGNPAPGGAKSACDTRPNTSLAADMTL